MIQKLPLSGAPGPLEQTDPPVKEVLVAREFDAFAVSETTRGLVAQKSGFSEDEARLQEEALRNAVNEIEALSKTAVQAANQRTEKERHTPSENPQRAEGACEHAKEEAHRDGEDFIQSVGFAESLKRETDFTSVTSQTPRTGVDLQHEDFAEIVTVQRAEKGIATYSEDLDIPADVIRRLNSDSPSVRSVGLSDLGRLGGENAFLLIARAFDEASEDVRNAAAVALFDLQSDRAASFARALREGSPEHRRRIGAALAASGLADIAIGNLAAQTREKAYEAFALLFLMIKAGEVQPLVRAVEDHPNIEVRLAVIKLLALNGEAEIVPSFRQLAVRGVLPSEVRAAVIEAIYEIGRQVPQSFTPGTKGI